MKNQARIDPKLVPVVDHKTRIRLHWLMRSTEQWKFRDGWVEHETGIAVSLSHPYWVHWGGIAIGAVVDLPHQAIQAIVANSLPNRDEFDVALKLLVGDAPEDEERERREREQQQEVRFLRDRFSKDYMDIIYPHIKPVVTAPAQTVLLPAPTPDKKPKRLRSYFGL